MKKILSAVIVLQAIALTCLAQSEEKPKTSSISIGYGFVTSTDVIEGFEEILILPAGATFQDESGTGSFIINFKAGGNKKFKIGGEAVFQSLSKDVYSSNQKIGAQKTSYLTFAPRFDYYWTTGILKLYSGAGLGLTLANQKYNGNSDSQVFVNFQLNLLGLETGGKVCFYAEGGFGYDGVLNGGIRFRF
jgi:hypothetical protein